MPRVQRAQQLAVESIARYGVEHTHTHTHTQTNSEISVKYVLLILWQWNCGSFVQHLAATTLLLSCHDSSTLDERKMHGQTYGR
jgi:hypothetical protein